MRFAQVGAILAVAAVSPSGWAWAEEDGKVLYDTKCAMCHGKTGVAKPAANPSKDFDDPAFQKAWSVDAIAKITTDGKGKMPAYRTKLTPAQIRSVAAHVKTLGPAQ